MSELDSLGPQTAEKVYVMHCSEGGAHIAENGISYGRLLCKNAFSPNPNHHFYEIEIEWTTCPLIYLNRNSRFFKAEKVYFTLMDATAAMEAHIDKKIGELQQNLDRQEEILDELCSCTPYTPRFFVVNEHPDDRRFIQIYEKLSGPSEDTHD